MYPQGWKIFAELTSTARLYQPSVTMLVAECSAWALCLYLVTLGRPFCFCDLDLDPMTLIYEYDLDILKMNPMAAQAWARGLDPKMSLSPPTLIHTTRRLIVQTFQISIVCANCFGFWETLSPGILPGLHPWTVLGDICLSGPLGYSRPNENYWCCHYVRYTPLKKLCKIVFVRTSSNLHQF